MRRQLQIANWKLQSFHVYDSTLLVKLFLLGRIDKRRVIIDVLSYNNVRALVWDTFVKWFGAASYLTKCIEACYCYWKRHYHVDNNQDTAVL